jgi:hypothetical protein
VCVCVCVTELSSAFCHPLMASRSPPLKASCPPNPPPLPAVHQSFPPSSLHHLTQAHGARLEHVYSTSTAYRHAPGDVHVPLADGFRRHRVAAPRQRSLSPSLALALSRSRSRSRSLAPSLPLARARAYAHTHARTHGARRFVNNGPTARFRAPQRRSPAPARERERAINDTHTHTHTAAAGAGHK